MDSRQACRFFTFNPLTQYPISVLSQMPYGLLVVSQDNVVVMKKLIVVLLGTMWFLIKSATATAVPLDDYTFFTEEHPPFNFQTDGEVRGINVDLLLEIFRRTGTSKSRNDIVVAPWTRAYMMTREYEKTALFGIRRTIQREREFKWVGPIMESRAVLIARKDRKIRIEKNTDMMRYSFGVIRENASEQFLRSAGVHPDQLVYLSSPRIIAQAMERGRVDVWPYEELSADWVLREQGLRPTDFETVGIMNTGQLYFAFHVDTDDSILAEVQSTLDEIKSDGTFVHILNTYKSAGSGFMRRPDIVAPKPGVPG